LSALALRPPHLGDELIALERFALLTLARAYLHQLVEPATGDGEEKWKKGKRTTKTTIRQRTATATTMSD
jgi:hypothetical protein